MGMGDQVGADGLLYLLRAEPTLAPEAPADCSAAQMEHRREGEVHACLRCGARAVCAYVADTVIGPRWLDLCPRCDHWLRTTSTEGS
ncbi:hypothetical protein [Actinomadura algeriensis]|uniref:Uncharacterized protein n=1 Tax=Actinomadura algeriensis TaxID=1679523 RepID=A0ABR9JIZ0_9ACTN|nr:hypothetical protein [Actinomadura algeriensis]MBE1530388.1 hypothetical protein [Actinomadura algeriensis]